MLIKLLGVLKFKLLAGRAGIFGEIGMEEVRMYKQVQIIQHMVWYFVPTYYFYSQYNTKNTYFNIAHMYTSFRTVGRYVPTLCFLGMYYYL